MSDRLPEPRFQDEESEPLVLTEETVARTLAELQRGERWDHVNMLQVDVVAENPEIIRALALLYPEPREQAPVVHAGLFTYSLLRAQAVADIEPLPPRVEPDTVHDFIQELIHMPATQPVQTAAARMIKENPWLVRGTDLMMQHLYSIAHTPTLTSVSTAISYELIRRQRVRNSIR